MQHLIDFLNENPQFNRRQLEVKATIPKGTISQCMTGKKTFAEQHIRSIFKVLGENGFRLGNYYILFQKEFGMFIVFNAGEFDEFEKEDLFRSQAVEKEKKTSFSLISAYGFVDWLRYYFNK